MSLRQAFGWLAFGMLATALGCGQGGQQSGGGAAVLHFTLPHVLTEEHPVHKALVRFADEVKTRSNGTMTVTIFPGGTMGNEPELTENVAHDINDLTKVSSTILENKTPLAKVYSLPYLFRDEDHMWAVFNSDIGKELLDMALAQGLKGICYFDAGARSFYTKQPVTTPADLRGMKIRVQRSVMMQQLVESLGASPMQIAFSELYTALDTGVVSGAENNIPSYYTTQHYKVAPYFVFDEHARLPDILLMSTERWNGLSAEQQAIIMDSAAVAVDFEREIWASERVKDMQAMQQAGVTFTQLTDAQRQQFVDATRPVYDEVYQGDQGDLIRQYVERIRAVQTGP